VTKKHHQKPRFRPSFHFILSLRFNLDGFNMASVSSLDHDMRKLRLDRYTPGAAKEVRSWIESMLGESLSGGDLMDALKDGVALCK
jgi:hypothetical protein